MQGVVPRQASDLNSRLKRSLAWTSTARGHAVDSHHRYQQHRPLSGSTASTTTNILHDRLDEVLVLELLKDGGRQYLTLSVRGLYKHVLAAITAPPPEEIQSLTMNMNVNSNMTDNLAQSIQTDTIPEDKPLTPPTTEELEPTTATLENDLLSSVTSTASIRQVPNVMLGSLLPATGELGSENTNNNESTSSNNTNQTREHDEETEIVFQSKDEQLSSQASPTSENSPNSPWRASPPGQGHAFASNSSNNNNNNSTSSTRPAMTTSGTRNSTAPGRGFSQQPMRSKSVYKNLSSSTNTNTTTTSADPSPGEAGAVTYRERLGGYLHPRDMRRLVTPFSASNEPDLIVRRHAMLLNFDPLRAIILRDRLLVLIPDGADSLLVDLERRVRGGSKELEAHIFGVTANELDKMDSLSNSTHSNNSIKDSTKKTSIINRVIQKTPLARQHTSDDPDHASKVKKKKKKKDDTPKETNLTNATAEEFDHPHYQSEWEDLKGKEWIQLPFELQCADAVLQTVVGLLQEDTHELQMATLDYIEQIISPSKRRGYREDPLTIIRAVKDSVREMTARVKGFVKSMNDTLDDYEDMALMNLSRLITVPERFIQPVPQEVLEEESDEPELILESYLQHAMSVMNVLDLIQGQIDTAAELVDQKLDATRNKILLANTLITLTAFCIQCATLVAGFLGMNLTNHMEQSEDAFNKVTYWTLAATVILFFLLMYIMQRTETMPGWNSFNAGGL